jgi:hypothetical protein
MVSAQPYIKEPWFFYLQSFEDVRDHSEDVAEHEDEDDKHQHEGQVLLLLLLLLPENKFVPLKYFA